MTIYNEAEALGLLAAASDPDGDPVTVRRINGTVVSSWPHAVALPWGTAFVGQGGTVTYDDGGSTVWHPGAGATKANGSFTFTLWDGQAESATCTATVSLQGAVDTPPMLAGGSGWDPARAAGTAADYYVQPGGSSGGNGSLGSPFNTLAAALSAAVAAGGARVIRIRAGTLREAVSTAGFQGTIARYGAERAVISGAEVLTGWTQCTSGDAADVGANWASIWKTSFTVANAPNGQLRALNLCEAGVPMPFAQSRPASTISRYFFTYDRAFHRTGTWQLSGSAIIGVTDTTVIPAFTDTQLQRAFAAIHITGNTVRLVNITGSSAAAGTLTLSGNHAQDATKQWYALVNLLPAMQVGEWGYIDNGDGTATVYCRPANPANLAGGIEYSRREYCINYSSQQAGPVTLEGLEVVQAAGGRSNPTEAKTSGICVGTMNNVIVPATEGSNSRRPQPITIRHCYIGRNMGAGGDFPRGALYLYKANNAVVENVTLEWCGGSFGMMLHGDPGDYVTGARVSNIHGRFTAQAPARFFGCVGTIHEFSLYESCGFGGHTNQFNWYAGCDRNLNFGIRTRDCIGYVTWQDASRTHFLFCDIMASADEIETGGRALTDQNGNNNPDVPNPTLPSYVIHCRAFPHPARLAQDSSVLLGDGSLPGMAWSMINCVLNGGGMSEAYSTTVASRKPGLEGNRSGNLYTDTAFWQTAAYGWALNASETVSTRTAVYDDPATGDFRAKAGGPLQTLSGVSWAAELADLQAQFPGYDFLRDLSGAAVSAAAPGFVGPLADRAALR